MEERGASALRSMATGAGAESVRTKAVPCATLSVVCGALVRSMDKEGRKQARRLFETEKLCREFAFSGRMAGSGLAFVFGPSGVES